MMSDQECPQSCSSCGANCPSRETGSLTAPVNSMSKIRKVVAVMSGKGGVGKSLVTGLLAVLSRRKGLSTAILDADITGPSIPHMFGITEKASGSDLGIFPALSKTGIEIMSINLLLQNDTDPVLWRGPIIGGAIKQFWSDVVWNDVDIMFIDMPPGTGDVALTTFQSLPIHGIIIVTSPQELVEMIVRKAAKMAQMMNIPLLGLVENMSYVLCPNCNEQFPIFGESHPESLAEKHQIPSIARLPLNPKLAAACDKGMIELFEGDWLDDMLQSLIKDL